ncbi:MAG TPA: hypothetical protein DCL44_06010 [Elusimicrobia bacterium]|nr:hypothetical protein [Elusimicrobiota bacterium]
MTISLKVKFFLAALLTVLFTISYAFTVLRGQNTMAALLRENLPRSQAILHSAMELKHAVVLYDDLIFRYIATSDAQLLEDIPQAKEKAKYHIENLKKLSPGKVVVELLEDLLKESDAYFADAQKLISSGPNASIPSEKESILKMIEWARSVPRQQTRLVLLSSGGRARLAKLYSLCDRICDLSKQDIQNLQVQSTETSRSSRSIILWSGAIITAASLLLTIMLALSVLTPLHRLLGGIKKVIDGDLSFEIPPTGNDEVGKLTQSFNHMTRQLKEKEDRLVKETITDALTGAYNFRYFQEVLKAETERARRYKRPLSVLMLDIDHFKNYNDTHGHEMGNVLLKHLTQTIRENIRPSDVLARYGGEEFVVLLPDSDDVQGKLVAERLRETIFSADFPGQETQPEGTITVSMGGTSSSVLLSSARDLVLKADKSLYKAKQDGRNRVEWSATGK